MIELPSNLILEKTLNNSLKVGSLHHAVLIHGENHTGKLALALQLASHLLCQENLANPCQTCQQCLSMLYLQNPHLIIADRSEREHNVRFLSYLLEVVKEKKKQLIYEKIQLEVRLLINRHRQQYYKTVKKEKSSQPELIKISDKELEKLLHSLYLKVEKPFSEENKNQFLTEEFFESIKLVQNSLDRSVLIKESVAKIFSKLDVKTSNNRVFILEHIDLIHHDIVPSLLKKLEEPPANVYFILLNDSRRAIDQAVLKPLNSRCIKLNLANNARHFKNYYEKLAGLSLEENEMGCTNPFDFVSNKLSRFDHSLFESPKKINAIY